MGSGEQEKGLSLLNFRKKNNYLLLHDNINIGKILGSNELKLPIGTSLRKGLTQPSILEDAQNFRDIFLNAADVHILKLKFSSTANKCLRVIFYCK